MLQEMGVGGWLRHATAPLPEALAEPGIEARADGAEFLASNRISVR